MPGQASQLFGQNISQFLEARYSAKGWGSFSLYERKNVVVRGVTVTLHGESMWPPPEVKVSVSTHEEDKQEAEKTNLHKRVAFVKHWWKVLAGVLAVALIMVSPVSVAGHYIVFMLAVVVGFYVITNVTHTLHTPLNVGNQRYFRHHHRGRNFIDRIRQLSRADSFFCCYGNCGN